MAHDTKKFPPGTEVVIHEDDIGDDDCRKLVFDIYAGNQYVTGGFKSRADAAVYCDENELKVISRFP